MFLCGFFSQTQTNIINEQKGVDNDGHGKKDHIDCR